MRPVADDFQRPWFLLAYFTERALGTEYTCSSNAGGLKRRGQPWRPLLVSNRVFLSIQLNIRATYPR